MIGELSPGSEIDPVRQYKHSLQEDGFTGQARPGAVLWAGREIVRWGFVAVVMTTGEYAERLSEHNMKRFRDWQIVKRHANLRARPLPEFVPNKILDWDDLRADKRSCYADSELGALVGATFNLFDLSYDASAQNTVAVV
jgi:hypothetical protein